MPLSKTAMTAVALAALLLSACSGLNGVIYVRNVDGSIGQAVANTQLRFISEDSTTSYSAVSDANGRYSVDLPTGRYYTRAAHSDYADSTSAPGFSVVSGISKRTANYFLRSPGVTTVIIVRHAEKQDPQSTDPNEPLSIAGTQRAQALKETLFRAGVTAVYSTDTRRTRDTAAPLANAFHLQIQLYSNPNTLAQAILNDHRGDVVLVTAHSNTLGAVANALGGSVSTQSIVDYDNLYMMTIDGNSIDVSNLQYGADSTPDLHKNDKDLMALFLVLNPASNTQTLGGELRHMAVKAGVDAIYVGSNAPLVQPLASALNLTPATYDPANIASFVNTILTTHAHERIVISASRNDLRALIQELNGSPTPVVYASDVDQFIVVMPMAGGSSRVIPLRF